MRKIPTPEEIEAYTIKQLSENPWLTREMIDEWDKAGKPVTQQDWQELRKGLTIEEEPVNHSINPICQNLLNSDIKASQKVTELVNIYLEDHPDFVPPEEEFIHPSYLALYRPIKHWFFTQCGSKLELWTLMLAAAKEWFPDKSNTKLGHTFCVRFEIEDCTWWNGRTEFQPVLRDYIRWRYDREM